MTSSVSICCDGKLERLQQHLKDNGVLSVSNARYASKTFGALFEWVLCILTVSSGRAIIHFATSAEMIDLLASSSNLQVDICDEVRVHFTTYFYDPQFPNFTP
jgi:hypothetical protein